MVSASLEAIPEAAEAISSRSVLAGDADEGGNARISSTSAVLAGGSRRNHHHNEEGEEVSGRMAAGTEDDNDDDESEDRRWGDCRWDFLRTDICVTLILLVVIVGISAPIGVANASHNRSSTDGSGGSGTAATNPGAVRSELVSNDALREMVVDSGHACAIRSGDGSVFCWGNQVRVPPDLFSAASVAVGDGFSCAVRAPNAYNQDYFPLDPEASSRTEASTEPGNVVCWGEDVQADYIQPPADLGPASFLVATGETACAIHAFSGTGRCWGFFEFGRGEVEIPVGPLREIVVPLQERLSKVCVVLEDTDTVRCWWAPLPTPSANTTEAGADDRLFPLAVPDDLGPVSSLAMMEDFVCAVPRDANRNTSNDTITVNNNVFTNSSASTGQNSLRCWYYNETTATTTTTVPHPLPNEDPMVAGEDFVAVFPGHGNAVCALTSDGRALCFEDDGKTITGPPPLIGPVVSVSSDKNDYRCAVRKEDGLGVCWGGAGVLPGHLAPIEPEAYAARFIATGQRRTCAVLRDGRQVDCWGAFGYRLRVDAASVAVGNAVTCVIDQVDSLAKCVVGDRTFILEGGRVRRVEVSSKDMVCTIGSEGENSGAVRCYQINCGSAGNNQVSCFGTPDFTGNPEGLFDQSVAVLALGARHFCAIQQDTRELDCWEDSNSLFFVDEEFPEAQVPEDLLPVIDVAVGDRFTCAIQITGVVACWGDTSKPDLRYVLEPPPGSYYTAIAASEHEACAITFDQLVHCWGRPFISSVYVPTNLFGVIQISGGADHFCALQSNDESVCWGSNRNGELARDYFS